MSDPTGRITWKEISGDFQIYTKHERSRQITPLASGLEADVFKVSTPESSFVLKVWNRDSRPDISNQYQLLVRLYHQGIAVSKPFAWGLDEHNHQVLLTSFDGSPVNKVYRSKLTELANLLIAIHDLPYEMLENVTVPQYDFITHFFPAINEHKDIKERLLQLIESSRMVQNRLIHGDYNLRNILESDGKYTIIDWTNFQLGDPRYDIAWSTILIWIYVSERHYTAYRNVFIAKNNNTEDELELFEAIACLRWILLNRIADLPKRYNTRSTVRTILMRNRYLHEDLL